MSINIELVESFLYNTNRGYVMIESFSEWISMLVVGSLLAISLFVMLRVFFYHRRVRLQEEEIEYYQDW
jgi:hypothetical protein